mgnify:CR=1 FL=1
MPPEREVSGGISNPASPGERLRLDAAAAGAFLRKLGERLDYNINIMDREGVIIASRDPARVGTYHAAARHLLESGSREERISPGDHLPEGTTPGVNLPLEVRGEVLGVVGVTGDPQVVGDLAQAVKTSVESMIELEAMREAVMNRRSRKTSLMAYLLYEEAVPESAVLALAGKLGYDPAIERAALLLRLPAGRGPEDALAQAKARGAHDAQDIASSVPDGSLLVFRRLGTSRGDAPEEGGPGILAAYRGEVEAYCRAFSKAVGIPRVTCFAGSPQRDFSRYRGSYRQALWLASRIPGTAGDGPVLILDHLEAYFLAQTPRIVLDDALASISARVPAELRRTLAPMLEALEASGFNAKEAAARLGVHRNTLSARMDRLSAFLGCDPRSDAGALSLSRAVAGYMKLRGGPVQDA